MNVRAHIFLCSSGVCAGWRCCLRDRQADGACYPQFWDAINASGWLQVRCKRAVARAHYMLTACRHAPCVLFFLLLRLLSYIADLLRRQCLACVGFPRTDSETMGTFDAFQNLSILCVTDARPLSSFLDVPAAVLQAGNSVPLGSQPHWAQFMESIFYACPLFPLPFAAPL